MMILVLKHMLVDKHELALERAGLALQNIVHAHIIVLIQKVENVTL